MRLERIVPGRTPPDGLAGAILTRDLAVEGGRLPKGRRLTPEHLRAIGRAPLGPAVVAIVPEPWEVHEDDAALRLAAAVAADRPELALRGPVQSRVDLVATAAGVVDIRLPGLLRLNAIDPLEVFTVFDGQVVEPGDLVASVKIAPHLVPEAVLLAGERLARRGGPLVRVRPFLSITLGVLVKGEVSAATRQRFEASIRAKATGLRATLGEIAYVRDDPDAVREAMARLTAGEDRADILVTAGGASTDPSDPLFTAVEALGGALVRRGVPAHPGSMLWLAVVGGTTVVGLPSCGAYSMATAADLLLPRLAAGQPPTAATVARLAHGGILARTQRFRFPAYARDLVAPDG